MVCLLYPEILLLNSLIEVKPSIIAGESSGGQQEDLYCQVNYYLQVNHTCCSTGEKTNVCLSLSFTIFKINSTSKIHSRYRKWCDPNFKKWRGVWGLIRFAHKLIVGNTTSQQLPNTASNRRYPVNFM